MIEVTLEMLSVLCQVRPILGVVAVFYHEKLAARSCLHKLVTF